MVKNFGIASIPYIAYRLADGKVEDEDIQFQKIKLQMGIYVRFSIK